MDFSDSPKKPKPEAIVPMINVVFLLLVFFLMAAHIAQPDPFEITRPTASKADGPKAESDAALYVGKDGALQYGDHSGEAAFAALAVISETLPVLQIRIDATLDGDRLAQVMKRLTQAGLHSIEVVVEQK